MKRKHLFNVHPFITCLSDEKLPPTMVCKCIFVENEMFLCCPASRDILGFFTLVEMDWADLFALPCFPERTNKMFPGILPVRLV